MTKTELEKRVEVLGREVVAHQMVLRILLQNIFGIGKSIANAAVDNYDVWSLNQPITDAEREAVKKSIRQIADIRPPAPEGPGS